MTFDVRLVALDASGGRDPVAALVSVFRLDPARAEQLVRRLPYVVKRGVTRDQAERLLAALRRIGASAEILPSVVQVPTEASLVAPLPTEAVPFRAMHPPTNDYMHPIAPEGQSSYAPLSPPRAFPPSGGRNRVPAAAHAPPAHVAHAPEPSSLPPWAEEIPTDPPRKQDPRGHTRPMQAPPRSRAAAQPEPLPAARPHNGQAAARPAAPSGGTGLPRKPATQPRMPSLARDSSDFEADISAVLPRDQAPPAPLSPAAFREPQAPAPREPGPYRDPRGAPQSRDAGSVREPTSPQFRDAPTASLRGPGAPLRDPHAGVAREPAAFREPQTASMREPKAGYREPARDAALHRESALPGHVEPAPQREPSPREAPALYRDPAPAPIREAPVGFQEAPGAPAHETPLFAAAAHLPDPGVSNDAAPRAPINTGAFVAARPPVEVQAPLQPSPTAPGVRRELPSIAMFGPPVVAKQHVVSGTLNAAGWSWVLIGFIALGALAAALLIERGYLLPSAMGVLAVRDFLRSVRAMRQLRATGLHCGQSQVPELYACVKQFALRLGLSEVPIVIVTGGSVPNVRARRRWSRLAVEIDEDFASACLTHPRPEVLAFHIAHELARHALGHTRALRRLLATLNPRLSQVDVLSADAVATALVGDRAITRAALAMLLAQGGLVAHIDLDDVERAATSLSRERFASWAGSDPRRCVLARVAAFSRGYR